MSDDYMKKYEEEYEKFYGQQDDYSVPQATYSNSNSYQQQPPQTYNAPATQSYQQNTITQSSYNAPQNSYPTYQAQNTQSTYQAQSTQSNYQAKNSQSNYGVQNTQSNYAATKEDFSLNDYYGGGSKKTVPAASTYQQEDNFSMADFYGTSKKTAPAPTQQYQQPDNFSMADFYGTSKKTEPAPTQQFKDQGNFSMKEYYGTAPKTAPQPTQQNQDQGNFSMKEYYGTAKKATPAPTQQYQDQGNFSMKEYYGTAKKVEPVQQYQDQYYDQSYQQNQGYNENQNQYHQHNDQNYQQNNQDHYYQNNNQYYQQAQPQVDPNIPAGMSAAEWAFKQQVAQNQQRNKEADRLQAQKELAQSNNQYQQSYYVNQAKPAQGSYQYSNPAPTPYNAGTAQTQGNSYGSQANNYNQAYQAPANPYPNNQNKNSQTNQLLSNVAGDVAVKAVEQNMTAENIEAASKHATKENAMHAYDGAVYLNDKADEYGIDKKAVAQKAGSAAWTGTKAVYNASAGVDWTKVANNVQEANK